MYDFSEISARRMSDPHLEVPNIFEKQAFVMFLLLKSSKSIFPVPGRRYLKSKDFLYICYTFPNFRKMFGTSIWDSEIPANQKSRPKFHLTKSIASQDCRHFAIATVRNDHFFDTVFFDSYTEMYDFSEISARRMSDPHLLRNCFPFLSSKLSCCGTVHHGN